MAIPMAGRVSHEKIVNVAAQLTRVQQLLHADLPDVRARFIRSAPLTDTVYNSSNPLIHLSGRLDSHDDDAFLPSRSHRRGPQRPQLRLIPKDTSAKCLYTVPRREHFHGDLFGQRGRLALRCQQSRVSTLCV